MEFNLNDLKMAVEVINKFGNLTSINDEIERIEAESEREKKEYHTIETDSYDKFESIVRETLIEEIQEDTPHGEYGCDSIEGEFCWNGETYKAYLEPFWNRYDKQYYYIDGVEKFTLEKVE